VETAIIVAVTGIVVVAVIILAAKKRVPVRLRVGEVEAEVGAPPPDTSGGELVRIAPVKPELVATGKESQPRWERAVEHDHDVLFGVDKEVSVLSDLVSRGANRSITAVCGEGGLGKTALTYEAVSAVLAETDHTVAWASARQHVDSTTGSRSSLRLGVKEVLRGLCDQLGLDRPSDSLLDQALIFGVKDLARRQNIIMVVDNIESPVDLRDIVRFFADSRLTESAHIVVTTRPRIDIRTMPRGVALNQRPLTGLGLEPARRLIRHVGGIVPGLVELDDRRLDAITRVVDGNPYLIKIITRRLCYGSEPLNRLLAEIQDVNDRKQASASNLASEIKDYMFQFAIAQLDDMVGTDARAQLFGVFCSEPQGSRLTHDHLCEYSGLSDDKFRDALNAAVQLSLVRSDDLNERFSIHSLLHAYMSDAADGR
jgi:hypothetical protein